MDSDHPLSTVHQGSALFFDQQRSVGPQFHGVGARPQHLGNVSGTIGTSYAKELRFAERKAAATAPFPAGLRPQQGVGGPCPRCGTLLLWMAIGGKGSICRPRCQPPEK